MKGGPYEYGKTGLHISSGLYDHLLFDFWFLRRRNETDIDFTTMR
jgi:hypothetical protein